MYSTLMVYLEPNRDNRHLLAVTQDLAERFDASVIGITAAQRLHPGFSVRGISGDIFELDRQEIEQSLAAAEHEFRAALQHPSRHVEWRSIVADAPLIAQFASQIRSADLVITQSDPNSRHSPNIAPGDMVMMAGRPLLIVPAGDNSLPAQNILIAWKDSRESRRAVSDGLPFLKAASRVQVLEIADADEMVDAGQSVKDVVDWLKRHGIEAEGKVAEETGDHALQLAGIVEDEKADLIIAGAYGYSRLHEWALGGVTYDLLLRSRIPTLLSR